MQWFFSYIVELKAFTCAIDFVNFKNLFHGLVLKHTCDAEVLQLVATWVATHELPDV